VIENNQDFNPASLNAGLTASRDFDMPTRTITLGSNMNNIEDDFTQGDSTPF
jgi:hypothetical protein